MDGLKILLRQASARDLVHQRVKDHILRWCGCIGFTTDCRSEPTGQEVGRALEKSRRCAQQTALGVQQVFTGSRQGRPPISGDVRKRLRKTFVADCRRASGGGHRSSPVAPTTEFLTPLAPYGSQRRFLPPSPGVLFNGIRGASVHLESSALRFAASLPLILCGSRTSSNRGSRTEVFL